jgi:predicted RND superfamily exporter protein
MKKSKDVKFIIYQSLYIFVVCVIAIKGANLDLTQVVEDDGKPKVFLTPDSLQKLYEIIKKSIIVDTNIYVIIKKEDLAKMDDKIRQLVVNPQNVTVSTSTVSTFTTNNPRIEQPEIKEEEKKDPGEMQEIRIGNIQLTQFTMNTLNNPYDTPLEVEGITTIPPKSSKTFETGGQSSIVIKVGNQTKTVSLKPNEKPKINIQRVASMGEETRVTYLQSSTCFRVTIGDDFPGQLDVKFNGPITVKTVGSGTYDITMNAFGSKSAFDNFTDGKDSPYSVGFTVSVTDKIAGHKITGQNSFSFGEW